MKVVRHAGVDSNHWLSIYARQVRELHMVRKTEGIKKWQPNRPEPVTSRSIAAPFLTMLCSSLSCLSFTLPWYVDHVH